MERSDKQRKPVAIKNLSELKRFIQPGVEFKTLSQKNHPDLVGLTRVVTTVQTVCFYSKIKDQPNSRFSTDNGGKGFRTDFAKADAYIFDGTTVKVKDTRNKDRGVIYEFEFYDREQTMQEDTNMDRKMVNFIREQYPPGTRIRLNSMEDPYAPIAPGTEGEVDFVDDIGTIHMKWDNGRALGIVPGEDSFSVLPPKLTTLKLYMPLTADFYERSEYGDLEPESTMLDGRALRGYQAQITAALMKNRVPEETERGLMHWYHEADSVNTKVHSAVFTVEERNRKLWGVAECRIAGELNAAEMDTLKEYIAGQASDGWGEHFEQQEKLVDGGSELYVHLWNADDWGIQTEQERFAPKLAEGLPELCFSVLPSTGELICIKRGENGYYPSDWSTDDPAQNRELADYNNARLGVPQAQRLAMECGSMEQVRLVKEMRNADEQRGRAGHAVRPRYMLWENVPGAFSSGAPKGEDFRIVLEEIVRVKCGSVYVPGPYPWPWQSAGRILLGTDFSLAWRCLDAQYWGLAQRRKRIFLVADFAGRTADKILFIPEGMFGNPTPSF